MKKILVIFLLLSSLFFSPAYAEEKKVSEAVEGNFEELKPQNPVIVARIIDALHIQTRNGQIFQLANIEVPGINPYNPSEHSINTKKFLEELLLNEEVKVHTTKTNNIGRYNQAGYYLAHIERKKDKNWIQGVLISQGYARYLPLASNPEMASQMLEAENKAREERLGLWANEKFALLSPKDLDHAVGDFVIVEGIVHSIATIRNEIFINFGADLKSAFKIVVKPEQRKELLKINVNPMQLRNKRLRVRGWLYENNGPYILLAHPTMLEVLPEKR